MEELLAKVKKKPKIKMTRSELALQEKENYCICSVLQGIFKEHELHISQDEIADNLSPSNRGHLVHDDKIKDFLKSRGLDYNFYWHNETPFNEPDSLLEEICVNSGFIGIGIHTYRILAFAYPETIVDDPKDAKRKTFNLQELMHELRKFGGGFGLIKKIKL